MENLPTPARKQPAFRRPAIKLDGSQKSSDNSSSDAPDGAIFRQPMAPIQMTISPGNAADGAKLAEKLKKLELSRKKTTRSHPIDLKTPSKVDLVATERFFVESSVENVSQTPRTQSFREPLRTPARFLQEAMDPRDSMRSNATYVLNTPRMDRAQHPNSDPFTPALVTPSRRPATAPATATTPLAYEEKLERQFVALSSWANVILDSASFVSEIDLGTSKQDASLKLQEMLTKPPKKNGGTVNGEVKRKYTDLCLRKKCLDYLKRADSVYQSTHEIIGVLKTMVEKGQISIKSDVEVYANIGVQTSILSLLFSLHPFWLFIGVETVCAEFNDHDTASLDARLPFSSSSFAPATVRFIHEHILANANLMAKKKFAIGTVKKIVTPKGRDMLHKHCLNCILSMAVLLEYAKNSYLFENTPGLFVKNSDIKTVSDFSTELSRLVLSASGTPLNKAFDKCKFNRVYRQSFLEEYQYVMKTTRDMSDGIILGRLIELLTDSQPLKIIGNMRNPQGDRIRKKGNVEKALAAAAEADIDVDGISIDQILSAHRESCLDLMWRLVGVYVKKKAEQEPLRRESLCLEGTTDVEDADDTVMGAPLGGIADSAFTVYQQLAFQFGRHLSKWADLEDGLLLSSIWQYYNSSAPDIRFYDGETLFDKVAHAAESDLGIPLVLTSLRDERQLGLFAHMFLSRLISYKRLRDSEMSDAESDASSIVSIIRKEGANLTEETERIQRVRMESEREVSAKEEEERLKREAEKKREEELRMRFEEEEEERLSSEWRSPSRGIESIELEEKMLMEDGEAERIEEEMRRAQLIMEEERRLEEERVKKEEDERLAEEQRMREKEEEERRRMEEEEMERVKREKEEEERIRREEEVRLEEERLRKEEEEKERLRMIEETRVLAEEEERLKREEETRLEMERIQREEEDRRIEEARLKAEEEERLRREEEERLRLIEEARLLAEEEERMRREEEERVRKEEEERLRKEEEERLTLIEEARLRAVEEERLRREKEEEEKRERAAITIQCWTRGVYAVRLLKALKEERDERMKREEEEKRQKAGERIASWIYDRMTIRVAKKELEERRMNRAVEMEIERLRVEEEERRRKQAVLTIESWYSSAFSIRAARSLLQMMREERWKREEEIRLEMERLRREEEERVRREEEERMRREEEARLEMERIRMEEEERLKREEEERLRREEEARLEMERLVREEEERRRREEEERMLREEEARIEKERIEREEEEKRLRDEEEARVEMERLWNEEQERKMREEKEARLEQERLLREEQERLRREEEARVEMERLRKKEERRREEEELKIWAAKLAHEREERLYQEMLAKQEEDRRTEEMRQDRAARTIQSTVRPWLHKKRMEKRTMDLLREMTETSRLGRSERMTIGGMSDVSDDTLVAGVREIKRRQRKLSLTLSLTRQNRISDRQAAIRIQAWWRGIVVRHIHRKKIESMRVKMREFKDTAEKAMGVDNAERTVPVSKRLMRAKEYLTNGRSMYELKVACYTTMSLCRLTSLYCERAIVLDLHHLIINNFLIQADRSPAYEEIIEFGVQALEEMVKCKSARVRIEMVSVGVDLSKLAAHQMNAFPHHPVIPVIAMTILRMCKEILPVKTHAVAFEKINSYYLKQGEKRFVKLPLSDERHTAFVHLKNAFTE